jgi:hypothetical protein
LREGAIKAAKLFPLIGGEVTCRHSVRNSQVLRHISAAQKTKDKSFAKHMCETNHFSNMLCTPTEATV